MATTVIRWDDHKLVPWKNGRGVTRDIALGHRPDGTMQWRLGLATVDRDGPFSDFTGYKRIIMMLDGDGMILDFGGHGEATLDRAFVPVVFEGAWATTARLLGGPTHDLNVVTAHQDARSEVAVLPVTERLKVVGRGLTFVHVLAGHIAVADAVLAAGDTLRLDGANESVDLTPRGSDALIYRIDIDLAADEAQH